MKDHRQVAAAVAFGLQPLLLNGIGLFATAFIIHQLGPAQYGTWAVAVSLTSANAFLTNLGLRPLFVRSLSQCPDRTSDLLAEQLGARLALSLLGGLGALGLAAILRYPTVVILCVLISDVSLLLAVAWTVFGDVLQALQRFRSLAVATLTGGAILTAVSVVVAAGGGGPIALSAAYVTGPLVTLVLVARSVRREGVRLRVRFDARRSWALLVESKAIAGQQFVQTIRDRAEELLVPKLVGIAPFGLFAAGTMPSSRLAQVSDGIATAYYPAIARLRPHDPRAADRQIGALLAVSLVISLPLALVISFLAPTVASLLLSQGADTCALVMRITAWSVPLTAVVTAAVYAMQASGRHAAAARATVIATAIGAVTSGVLIWKFGIVGASWAWVARPVILLALLLPGFIELCPDVRMSVPIWRILTSAAVSGFVFWLFPANAHALIAVAGWTALAALAYGVALVALRVLPLPDIVRLMRGVKPQVAVS